MSRSLDSFIQSMRLSQGEDDAPEVDDIETLERRPAEPARFNSYADSVLAEVARAQASVKAAIAFYEQQRDTVLRKAIDEVEEFETHLTALRAALCPPPPPARKGVTHGRRQRA